MRLPSGARRPFLCLYHPWTFFLVSTNLYSADSCSSTWMRIEESGKEKRAVGGYRRDRDDRQAFKLLALDDDVISARLPNFVIIFMSS